MDVSLIKTKYNATPPDLDAEPKSNYQQELKYLNSLYP